SYFILLVNLRQELAADVFATGSLAAHQATRRRNDVDAVATEHLRNVVRADVNPAARSRDPLQVRNRRSTARVIAKEDAHAALDAFAFDDEVIDVAFFFQDSGNFQF